MVNILISTYNGESYIVEQLNSIEEQTYKDYHVYIRDDGSVDRTVQVIQDYVEQKSLWDKYTIAAQENIGFCRSFGELLAISSDGDYWAFCDQDDYWYPDKLENAVKWMEKENQNIPLLYHSRIDIGNEDLSEKYAYPVSEFHYSFDTAFTSNIFFGFATVINRELYERLVKVDFEKIKYHDWFAAIIVTAFGKYQISESPEAVHRQHRSNTSPLYFLKKIPDGLKLLKGDDFYTRNAREFYRLFANELDDEKKEFCKMFLNEKYDIRTAFHKAFYPKRWNPQWKVEIVIRLLMLIGKI